MEHTDLCISNYSLNDILELFKLGIDFDEEGLKSAKRTVLMTHPDKSGLDAKYFLFFKKAYSLLYNVFKIRSREQQDTCVKRVYTNEEIDESEDHREAWKNLSSRKDFNKVFNEMFEKHVVIGSENDGHGEWLKEEDDALHANNRSEMDEMIKEKKASLRSMVVYNGISEMGGDSGTSLTGVGGNNHSSMFSSLQYDDVRTAYTHSVVPVTEEDYNSMKQYSSVDSYVRDRDQELNNYKMEDHDAKYEQQKIEERKSDSYRAFSLARQDERYRDMKKAATGTLLKLTNSRR